MTKTIDTHLFIEIILSEGASFLASIELEGISIEYYTCHRGSGKRVPIITSDEFITTSTAEGLLILLGMESLADRLFQKT